MLICFLILLVGQRLALEGLHCLSWFVLSCLLLLVDLFICLSVLIGFVYLVGERLVLEDGVVQGPRPQLEPQMSSLDKRNRLNRTRSSSLPDFRGWGRVFLCHR